MDEDFFMLRRKASPFTPLPAKVYRPVMYRVIRPIYQDLLRIGYYDYTIYKKLHRLWQNKIRPSDIPDDIIKAAKKRAYYIRQKQKNNKKLTKKEMNFEQLVGKLGRKLQTHNTKPPKSIIIAI